MHLRQRTLQNQSETSTPGDVQSQHQVLGDIGRKNQNMPPFDTGVFAYKHYPGIQPPVNPLSHHGTKVSARCTLISSTIRTSVSSVCVSQNSDTCGVDIPTSGMSTNLISALRTNTAFRYAYNSEGLHICEGASANQMQKPNVPPLIKVEQHDPGYRVVRPKKRKTPNIRIKSEDSTDSE